MRLTENLARIIADELKIDLKKYPLKNLMQGMKVESEHKDLPGAEPDFALKSWVIYAQIAYAHMRENVDYYKYLEEMEKKFIKNENFFSDYVKLLSLK